MGLMGLIALIALLGCSSDLDEQLEPALAPTETMITQLESPITVVMSAASFEDEAETEEQRAARRAPVTAWEPPTGYYFYSTLYGEESYVNRPNLDLSTIDLFMTHDDAAEDAPTSENPLHARLSYNSTTEKWKLGLPYGIDEESVESGNYYVYGFVPKDAADNTEIEMLPASTNWADGAVLTIRGLKAVATDPCVIIGAKEGPDKDNCPSLQAGDFKFNLDTGKTTVDEKEVINPNYLYFLFDHLYAALNISMRVNGDYHALRHIKLKRLRLRTETSTGVSPYKTDVTITLRANNEGTNPVSDSDISYDNIIDSPTEGTIYNNNVGYPLTTSYSLFLGHFMPHGVSKLVLTSTYDVYDTKGNLVRKDCSATNTMEFNKLFSGLTESGRGWKYTIKLTINPTYLYVLSEPDLDSPTVVVN